jgi:hypothetical protein
VLKAYVDKRTRLGKSLVAAKTSDAGKAAQRAGDGETGRMGDKSLTSPASVSPSPTSPPQPMPPGQPVAQSTLREQQQ